MHWSSDLQGQREKSCINWQQVSPDKLLGQNTLLLKRKKKKEPKC